MPIPIQLISPIPYEQNLATRFIATISDHDTQNQYRSAIRKMFQEYSFLYNGGSVLSRTKDTCWLSKWNQYISSKKSNSHNIHKLYTLRMLMEFQYESKLVDANIFELLDIPTAHIDPPLLFPETSFSIQRELDNCFAGYQASSRTIKYLKHRVLRFMVFAASNSLRWETFEAIEAWVKDRYKLNHHKLYIVYQIKALDLFFEHLKKRSLTANLSLVELKEKYPKHGLEGIIKALASPSPETILNSLRSKKFCSSLADKMKNYLVMKRATGYIYEYEEYMLLDLDNYLFAHNAQLDQRTFYAWLNQHSNLHSTTQNHYYGQISQFCRYLRRYDINQFVPSHLLSPRITPLKTPTIVAPEDIQKLFEEIQKLPETSRTHLRKPAFSIMLTLLFFCGLRRNEVINLNIEDADIDNGVLTIKKSKFFKTRYVPMDNTVTTKLKEYMDKRLNCKFSNTPQSPLFCSSRHRRYFENTFYQVIKRLQKKIGLNFRLHDLRHTFAIRRLLAWYRQGVDVQAMLPILSQYMGHGEVAYTAHYLSLIPELADEAMNKFKAYAAEIRRPDHE